MNAPILRQTTKAEEHLAEAFAASGGARQPVRARAFEQFAGIGLPTRRIESWHYSDMRAAMPDAFPLAQADAGLLKQAVDGVSCRALAFGPDSGPDTLPGEDDPMVALNTAMASDGWIMEVGPQRAIAEPVELSFAAGMPEPRAEFVRHVVRVGAGSSLSLIERHASHERLQRNNVLVVHVGAGASVDHVFIADDHHAGLHVATLIVELEAGARFTSASLATGGRFLRHQIFVRFNGADATAHFSGSTLLRGRDHADTTMVVEHRAPGCQSREFFRHIVDDSASGVFQGKVIVAPGAQKTDGGMRSNAILLSDDAAMYHKPELEIFADDVVCGHGATCGELDAEQVFYAMSRGLPRQEAQALLLQAFAAETFNDLADDALRDNIDERIRAWLAQRRS